MPMTRHFPLVLALAAAVALPAIASAAPAQAKRHAVRHWHGYGFLPGYRTPEQIEHEDTVKAWRRGPAYWYGGPRFYRGRWNGGGFGPCWTQTPIGNVWNCGR
jgi:hypothetical protein